MLGGLLSQRPISNEEPIRSSTAPTVNDVADIGKIWVDESADKAYICLDNTPGAAIWGEAAAPTAGSFWQRVSGNLSPLTPTDSVSVSTEIITPSLREAIADGGIHLSLSGSDAHFYDYSGTWFSMSGSGLPDDGTNFYIPYNASDGFWFGYGQGANDACFFGSTGSEFVVYGRGDLDIKGSVRLLGDNIIRPNTKTTSVTISGGSNGSQHDAGARLLLYGGTHATLPGFAALDFGSYRDVIASQVFRIRFMSNLTITDLVEFHSGGVTRFFGDIRVDGSIGYTWDRIVKGWFDSLEITNMPTVGGVDISDSFSYVAPPITPTTTGSQGQWSYDAGYKYKCIAANTWVRWVVATGW